MSSVLPTWTDIMNNALVGVIVRRAIGEPGPDSRIDWLRCLLADLTEADWPLSTVDPPASYQALNEAKALLAGLNKAFPEHGNIGDDNPVVAVIEDDGEPD